MSTTEPLDETYLKWLYETRMNVPGAPPIPQGHADYGVEHWLLAKHLYKTKFIWSVPNDDNRATDGLFLRSEFVTESNIQTVDSAWMDEPCSVLEMLLGLSERAAFESSMYPQWWFYEMVFNLGLLDFNDDRMRFKRVSENQINRIVQQFLHRDYKPSGRGGLFPLEHPHEDQRDVEIWYQMSAYILERF